MELSRYRHFAQMLSQAGPRGRYAPSPTGQLHMGNLRTALLAWLFSRLLEGKFILRMEDLDKPREKPGSAASILSDLKWLGLDWDEGPDVGGPCEPYTQSERVELYHAVLTYLIERDLVFACVCSRREVAESASAPHGVTPIYPGTCRKDPTRVKPGSAHALRLKVDGIDLAPIMDPLMGELNTDIEEQCGDFIIYRSDGVFSYQFAVAVDDALMGVNHVVRGADLMSSASRQAALITLLNLPVPQYVHVPLMMDGLGQRMSKRDGSCSLAQKEDRQPERVVGELAWSCGLVDRAEPISLMELLSDLNVESLQRRLKVQL
ncbi:MAG: tRNA glutamyl-Q(34) synthetase GluQRS [Acidobacteria bacterium]|nr:tRNA glutamyl-Q(34) synthetase GluQRS [Acidobacteriota bacterium]